MRKLVFTLVAGVVFSYSLMPIAVNATAPTPDAHWTLDEASGNRADSIGSNHLVQTGTVNSVAGQIDNAADFPSSGGSKALNVADNATFSTGGETSFTISMWVKLHSRTGTQVFAGKYGGTGEYAVYYEHSFQRFVFSTYGSGSSNTYVLANQLGLPATDTWYHITAVHDAAANTNKISINGGAFDTVGSVPEPNDTGAAFTVGAFNSTGSSFPALASIDDVKFWRSALSQDDAEEVAATEPSPLIAHWKFDEGSGTSAIDSTGNGYTGTITEAAYSSAIPPVAFNNPYSLDFDGINDGVSTSLSLNNYAEFTLAGWAYPRTAESAEGWFGANDVFEFLFNSPTELRCWTSPGAVNYSFADDPEFLNNWHHITCIGDGENVILYVDGEEVARSAHAPTNNYGSGSNFTIGKGVQGGGDTGPFDGLIDDVRVYNRALTPEEMEGLGTGGSGPDSQAPTVSAVVPEDDSMDVPVGAHLQIQFDGYNGSIEAGAGSIHVYKSEDDTLVESIAANDPDQIGGSAGSVSIDLTDSLEPATEYYVLMDNNAFRDGIDNDLYVDGIVNKNTWNFTTLGDGPAGIGSGLRMWLDASKDVKDADDNSASDNEQAETWLDQSPLGRVASRQTSSGATYLYDGLNFNPTLDFNADNRYESSDVSLPAGDSDRSVFVVASNNNVGNWSYVFGYGSWATGNNSFDFGTEGGTGNGVLVVGGSQYVGAGSWLPSGGARLANGFVESGTLKLGFNGGGFTSYGGALDTVLDGSVRVGSQSGEYEHWDGSISEVIIYDRYLDSTERQRVNSYLALKYGFSLDQSNPQSYLASGDALMWDKDHDQASTYNNGLFGIGRDDDSELSQVKSVGQAATNIITIEADDEGTNMEPNFEDISDLEFLVIGDNSGDGQWTSSGAPDGYNILERQWFKQEQGNVGPVKLSINVNDSDIDLPQSETGQYSLLYDTDNDNSLADELPLPLTEEDEDTWSTTIDFSDGGLFTITSPSTPLLTGITPADNSVDIARNSNLTLTFDRNVQPGDEGSINIYKTSNDALVETIPSNSDRITGSGTQEITVDPVSRLDYSTDYYIQISSDAFYGPGEQYYFGLVNDSSWNFTTEEYVDDQDGISLQEEDASPNDGDANDDGTPDSEQSNVASFVNPYTDKYVVLESNQECPITSVEMQSETAGADADKQYTYPSGFMSFSLDCGDVGATAIVSQYYFETDDNDVVLRKYIPSTGAYFNIDGATVSTGEFLNQQGTHVTYEIVDGGELDLDGQENGEIIDPAGLGQKELADDEASIIDSLLAQSGYNLNTLLYLGIASLTAALILIICKRRYGKIHN